MFVLDSDHNGEIVIFSLDLKTWEWSKLYPSGHQSPPRSSYGLKASSWTHGGKIYYFGSKVMPTPIIHSYTNHLFCYNTSANAWEWPNQCGDIPSPRINTKIITCNGTVFLFGGFNGGKRYNDLYTLNLDDMRWTQIHGLDYGIGHNGKDLPQPKGMDGRTLTRFNEGTAVLFGGYGKHNSWLLDLEKIKRRNETSLIWTRIPDHLPRRLHAAVLEPVSKRLWVIGGEDNKFDTTANVLKMTSNLVPLKILAMDCAVRQSNIGDARLSPDHFPIQLKKELEEYRSKLGNVYLCNLEDSCIICQQSNDLQDKMK